MIKTNQENCQTCGKVHDFEKEQVMDCIPPKDVLKFGPYEMDKKYREALYKEYPLYTAREVVGSFLGHNSLFPSQDDWHDSSLNK